MFGSRFRISACCQYCCDSEFCRFFRQCTRSEEPFSSAQQWQRRPSLSKVRDRTTASCTLLSSPLFLCAKGCVVKRVLQVSLSILDVSVRYVSPSSLCVWLTSESFGVWEVLALWYLIQIHNPNFWWQRNWRRRSHVARSVGSRTHPVFYSPCECILYHN